MNPYADYHSQLKRLEQKLGAIDQDPAVHLEGLIWAKPITYWDYIHTDALLSLQIQRTTLPDEMVFIMYHQINELLFKMTLWEIYQVLEHPGPDAGVFVKHLKRISRYFDMLTSSFDIMKDGMEVEQYMKFRNTLTPASGFQSAQYRMVEFACTDAMNLVDARFRKEPSQQAGDDWIYEHLYWHAAGKDHATGKRNTLIRLFEEKYRRTFLDAIAEHKGRNLWSVYLSLPESERESKELRDAMRDFDRTVNIKWVLAHYHAAEHYLESGQKRAEATGGSDWKKYMHPRYQRRMFFPALYSENELLNWGQETDL
jgi:tryptophan 2,3-dioxygenase